MRHHPDETLLMVVRQLWPSLDDAQRVERVRELTEAGWSGETIATSIGVPLDTITVMRLRHRIEPMRPRPDARLPKQTRDTIARMTEAGATDGEIAAAIGVSRPNLVSRHRAAYRLPSPRKDLSVRPEVVQSILDMQADGMTMTAIARRTGYHRDTIMRLYDRVGLPHGHNGAGSIARTNWLLRDQIVRLVNRGLTPTQIAQETGQARSSVARILRELEATGRITTVRHVRLRRAEAEAAFAAHGDARSVAAALNISMDTAWRWQRKLRK